MPEQPPRAINAATRFCAVYGHPIRHSASPAMQNAGLAALGLDWQYLAFDVHPEHLGPAIAGAKAMNFIGLNLTVPHKLLAMELVDELDASAQEWGAVNTIRFEGRNDQGQWQPVSAWPDPPAELRAHGFNTDAEAMVQALAQDLKLQLAGTSVLVLGAGGAGRTAALKLASERVGELFLVNRTSSKAEAVAAEIRERWPEIKVRLGYPTGRVDLALNATSLGLRAGDGLPFDPASFSLEQASAVYDMIYRPAETLLLKWGKSLQLPCANGIGMLLYQGAKALEIWTGRKAPVETMRRALEDEVYGGAAAREHGSTPG